MAPQPPPCPSPGRSSPIITTSAAGAAGHCTRSPAAIISSSPQDEKSNASRRLGDTFTWPEALSSRAECSPSLGGPVSPQNRTTSRHYGHQRSASIASRDQPVREIPKQPKQNKPGFVEKKILHGEFMD